MPKGQEVDAESTNQQAVAVALLGLNEALKKAKLWGTIKLEFAIREGVIGNVTTSVTETKPIEPVRA